MIKPLTLLGWMALFGWLSLFGINANALVILQYHHISDKTPFITSTAPEIFEAHLDHLIAEDIEVVALEKALNTDPTSVGRNHVVKVAITFDDAFPSVLVKALPLLTERKLSFTLFVATDLIEISRNRYLSWEDLKTIQTAGGTIANHSTRHQHWARKPPDQSMQAWTTAFVDDALEAQATLEANLGPVPKLYALPYGEYLPALASALENEGFTVFGQQSGAMAYPPQLVVPRFPMGGPYSDINRFKTKVRTRPFPRQPKQHQPLLHGLETRPIINLKTIASKEFERITCFGPEGRLTPSTVNGNVLIGASQPLKPGRARYNCTQMSDQPGRYFWHSFFWMKLGSDNRWYPEP
jgi:peptidoglycan/xylan/chitin deacetylase (PgdA/CDA1 family)